MFHFRYIRSLSRCKVWEAKGGKSGSAFCKTDGRHQLTFFDCRRDLSCVERIFIFHDTKIIIQVYILYKGRNIHTQHVYPWNQS